MQGAPTFCERSISVSLTLLLVSCHFKQGDVFVLFLTNMPHRVFIMFLIIVGLAAFVGVGLRGAEYYFAPVSERALRPDYAEVKPSSNFSQSPSIPRTLLPLILYCSSFEVSGSCDLPCR